jgi:glyoxylase-like metal-dependent hydrolase (beta-lactamase superfamily II)
MSRLYFRQLLSGRDFATDDQIAQQMRNFCYLVGDHETGETVVVDPAYNVDDLVALADADGMKIVGALATHYHADHIGGSMMGHKLAGITELLSIAQVPIHVQTAEAEFVRKVTGVSEDDLIMHEGSATITVGEIPIELIHTPGHTPGSQTFLVDNHFLGGDTLFIDGCGRTDFPGGDAAELYTSLTQRLAHVPDEAVLFPGHLYSAEPSQSMGHTRKYNYVFAPTNAEQWLAMFGQ